MLDENRSLPRDTFFVQTKEKSKENFYKLDFLSNVKLIYSINTIVKYKTTQMIRDI